MPARKATTKGPKKSSGKAASKGKSSGPIRALYAVPIHDCIRRGDQQEMRQMAARARKHISEVKAALAALEKKMAAG